MIWKKYHEGLIPQLSPDAKKEIAMLNEMQLEGDMAYPCNDGETDFIVLRWGFPTDAYIDSGPYKSETSGGISTKDGASLTSGHTGNIEVVDTRMYHTLNASGTDGKCFVSYYVKLQGKNPRYYGCSVSEFAKLIGWEPGMGVAGGDMLPDTTPQDIRAEDKLALKRMKAEAKPVGLMPKGKKSKGK